MKSLQAVALAMGWFWSLTVISADYQRKLYAGGRGGMVTLPESIKETIHLSGKDAPHVLYLATPSYDEPDLISSKGQYYRDAGCTFESLALSWEAPGPDALRAIFTAADMICVGGGNTLFAYDRFVKLGIDRLIHEAVANGTVLIGGSAGGIVGFDGGHSDSMDPTTYKNPPGPLLNPEMTKVLNESWAYIRVPGLGLVNGLFCPHYDQVNRNGVLRAKDFSEMLRRHPGETGLGVDNLAALMIDGDNYTVVSRRDDECGSYGRCQGSVAPDGSYTEKGDGVPGVWKLTVNSVGEVARMLVPSKGRVSELLPPAKYIAQSNMLGVASAMNPDDGKPADWAQSPPVIV